MDATAQPDAMEPAARWVFFVGAPRCGTTSLAKYLRGHPQACLSRPKEPHFFVMRDLRGVPLEDLRDVVRNDFVDRFFSHRDGSCVFAEGSVSYLYAPERLEPVLRLWPEAKFIISIRNPLQMLPSLHQRHFVNGDETVKDFDRAWSLVPERRNGRKIPRSCLDPRFLDYWEAGYLGKYVQNFFDAIGRERCLVSVFDDLQANPKREYQRLLEFLGLPDDDKAEFERHAESRTCRLPWLQRLLQRPPRFALGLLDSDDLHNPRFAETVSPFWRKLLDMRTSILEWNEIPALARTIDRTTAKQMRAMYREDIALLSELIGRDLNLWLDPDKSIVPAGISRKQKELEFQA